MSSLQPNLKKTLPHAQSLADEARAADEKKRARYFGNKSTEKGKASSVNDGSQEVAYWEFSQSTGELYFVNNQTGERELVGRGYSGHGDGLKNPDMQDVINIGPIPRGKWTMGKQQDHVTSEGKTLRAAIPLTRKGTAKLKRSDFWIHGDNSLFNNSASKGCPVLGPAIRDRLARSKYRTLEVVR